MPIKLLNRQRELATLGKIRLGDPKPERGPGKSRDTWRFTSANHGSMVALHAAYGGTLSEWKDHPGEWQLLSQAKEISVIIDTTPRNDDDLDHGTSRSVDDCFDLYDGQTCVRKCDGQQCQWLEIHRDKNGKAVSSTDHGSVSCLCDPQMLGADLQPQDRKCGTHTTLRVMLPATNDVQGWQFDSHGIMFNSEVRATIDTFRKLGMTQGFCLLTIHSFEQTKGEKKKHWKVPRLTVDPNPPMDFVRNILAKGLSSQIHAIEAELMKEFPPGPKALPENGNGKPKPERLPLPPGFVESHETAQSLCQEFYQEQGWNDPKFADLNKQVNSESAVKGFYWPAMVILAKESLKDSEGITLQMVIEFIKAFDTQEPEVVHAEVVEDGQEPLL